MAEFTLSDIHDGACSVLASGEVDIAGIDAFLAAGRSALAGAATVLEIDLGEVTFIDSSGLGAMVRLRNEAVEVGKTVELIRVPSNVNRLLEVTGLAQALAIRVED